MTKRQENQISDRLNVPAKELVVEDMESLGTYRQEYDTVITLYVDMLEQYSIARDRFNAGGQQYAVAGAGGQDKKNPVLTTMEALRRDILAYSNALKLNPKEYEKLIEKKQAETAEPEQPKTMDELFSGMAFG